MLEEDKRGILLESGTNEIEVMEFTIFDSLYGINVAKVKEILVSAPVKPMPQTAAGIHRIGQGDLVPADGDRKTAGAGLTGLIGGKARLRQAQRVALAAGHLLAAGGIEAAGIGGDVQIAHQGLQGIPSVPHGV